MNDPAHPEETIFEAALALPSSERIAYLDRACAGQAGLRQLVEALLEANDEAGQFLESPAPGAEPSSAAANPRNAGAGSGAALPSAEKPGDHIGRYKLLQQIGEGGCGVVYMAEQEEPVHRRVALKVIKLGMDTKSVIARFDAERQALALMDHPNIARVLDAGATDTGRPFFVMELVNGFKITDYCDQNNLSTRERLGLFVQVCQAIQHAHQKGVIHRDLKPSNILVTLYDGVAVPKVIDFGIAKATSEQRLTDKTVFTQFAQFIGTPAYMSPEQAEMSALGIDTRSDIYSLGVLLYELLTGRTPFDTKDLLKAGLDEVRRIIREQEPVRPSTRLSTMLAGELTAAARHRQADPPKLIHLVRGDLDWIVMKALEKERARRYETANGLAMDVRRYLTDEPVVACPPSRAYRFQKLARRNKLAFAAVAAVLAALLIGLGVSTWLFVRERATRRALGVEAGKSEQAYAFLDEMLQSAGPEAARGRDTSIVLQILANTERAMDAQLKGQPEVQARLSATIGRVYDNLGEYRHAEKLLGKALRLQQSVAIKNDPVTPEYLDALGLALFHLNDLEGSAQLFREALEKMKKLRVQKPALVAQSLNNLGLARWKSLDLAGAQAAFKESLGLLQRMPADKELKVDMSYVLGNLGLVQWEAGDLAGAEASARQGLGLRKEVDGPEEAPDAQGLVNNLALVLRDRGDLAGAEAALRRALTNMSFFKLSSDHRDVISVRNNLAQTLRRKGAVSGDIASFREVFLLNPGDIYVQSALACALAKPSLTEILPGADAATLSWRYTAAQPAANWAGLDFVDSAWPSAPAPIGWPNSIHRSETSILSRTNLWLRREFELPELPVGALAFRINRNQDAQIFLNGVSATPIIDWSDVEVLTACCEAARATLKKGRNVLALHCEEADGGTPIGVALLASSDPTLGKGLLLADLNDAVAAAPERPELYSGRASAFARMGKWAEARSDLLKAIDLKPKSYGNWCKVAPLLLETGDVPGYQSRRQTALRSFLKPDGADAAEHVAKLALLAPLDGPELEAAGRLADLAGAAEYADGNLAWRQFVKGLAEFRRGHFAGAVEWQRRVLLANDKKALPGWTREAERNRSAAAYSVLAMAHQQSGQGAEAQSALAKGSEIVQTQFPPLASGDIGRDWPDWLIAHILLREAKGLIEGAPAVK